MSCRSLLLAPLFALLFAQSACIQEYDTCGGAAGFRCSMVFEESSSDDAGACFDDGQDALLEVQNRTGNTIEVIELVRCDGTDASEFPLMPPGLPTGEDVEIPLPGPGCWLLQYGGDGCEGEAPVSTEDDVCSGETFTWVVDDLRHVCSG